MSDKGLDAIATGDRTFAVVAMDQRGTLRRMFVAAGHDDPTDADLTAFKADILEGLRGSASSFLVDPDYGMPAARGLGDGPAVATLLAAEPLNRVPVDGEPVAVLAPGQDAAWVREQGADAMKFFVQMRPDRPVTGRDLTAETLEAMKVLVADCAEEGVPSVIENLIYPLPGEDGLTPERRADAIIESAALLDALQPDLLKLEYPGSPQACRRLADRITRPWAVLSAGVGMAEFADVLRISCDDGGASGFIAGRAIWKEAVGMPVTERRAHLADTGRRRFEECLSVIDGRARPWTEVSA